MIFVFIIFEYFGVWVYMIKDEYVRNSNQFKKLLGIHIITV